MTKDEIKALALECGFKLREQPDGSMDLNFYVYDFANQLIAAEREACAKVCEDNDSIWAAICAEGIRARSANA